ncbi:HigA family addiction module antitoxin [Pseudomonas oryzihabitans]|uniref:HigA family addiction module antitoxin n=1 Tax=Pseudomonas oryzihabitans TaxID=47885 RepID=UPI00111F43DE|nr:HigA family addiction module antitoxin [Pseudomonas psychrotolerans]QDD90663.1 addiction module antidote protein, HigA family [Pseudomonas psychrotolerans]
MLTNGMRPVHPGEILREEYLVPMGISASALARALGVSAPTVNDVVLERRGVTADMALRLAAAFDTTPGFWVGLQATYELRKAEIAKGEQIRAQVKPLQVA